MPRTEKSAHTTGVLSEKKPDRLGLVAKLLGIATAVLSIIFGLNQVTGLLSTERERDRHVAELMTASISEWSAGEYSAAWSHLEDAAKLVNATGMIAQLVGNVDKNRAMIQLQQEDLAMSWLEHIRLSGNQSFADVVGKLAPTLAVGASDSTGARKGDLLAHLGWGEFLIGRDGAVASDPTIRYREALAADPSNPYALAYLGHWETWRHGSLRIVDDYFTAALSTGRERAWVRQMQLSALRNVIHDADASVAYLRVVNAMRVNGEEIDEQTRNDLFQIYYSAFSGGAADVRRLLSGLPPEEQVITFKQLLSAPEFVQNHPSRDLYLAELQEAAGQKQDALQTLAELKRKLPPDSPLIEEANRATKQALAR